MLPNEVKAINLTDSRKIQKIITSIEGIQSPQEVCFTIKNLYTDSKDMIPWYIQACTPNGSADYKYTLSMKNIRTNKYLFKDISSSTGLNASIKLKATVNAQDSYMLTVQASGKSTVQKNWLGKLVYSPILWLYVGPYRSQQLDNNKWEF